MYSKRFQRTWASIVGFVEMRLMAPLTAKGIGVDRKGREGWSEPGNLCQFHAGGPVHLWRRKKGRIHTHTQASSLGPDQTKILLFQLDQGKGGGVNSSKSMGQGKRWTGTPLAGDGFPSPPHHPWDGPHKGVLFI
ncbi:hypothetical protein MLD38_011890 [Melastoma candidum]|uniref:Uncharacterized protein n=1 Tax=Melastoma candidum TaxID=119954 RepID=A0ACB9R4J6_9MYRT|nr:hypothetical protein MLD38_011890 [Melastoma candidum]